MGVDKDLLTRTFEKRLMFSPYVFEKTLKTLVRSLGELEDVYEPFPTLRVEPERS